MLAYYLYYCNTIAEISKQQGGWGGGEVVPEPIELYH